MIKSNILKTVAYPDEFTEEDKLEYDTLYAQAKIIHANVEKENPFIIHLAIIGHIRSKKGMAQPYSNEDLQNLKDSYKLTSKTIECDSNAEPYLYDTEKNPIFFPATITISADGINSNVVLER